MADQEIPQLEQTTPNQSEITSGVFSCFFFLLYFGSPYLYNFLNRLCNKDYNWNYTLSDSIEKFSKKNKWVLPLSIYSFIVCAYYFFSHKNFLYKNENNKLVLGLPILLYFFGFFNILLLLYPVSTSTKHKLIALFIIFGTQILDTFLFIIYTKYYNEKEQENEDKTAYNALKGTFIVACICFCLLVVFVLLTLYNFINSNENIIKLLGQNYKIDNNITNGIAIFEVGQTLCNLIILIIFIFLPKIP